MDTDQIAAETWTKMCAPHEGEYTDAMAIADIQSAIEKATDIGYKRGKNEGWNEGREHERKCHAAHASECNCDHTPHLLDCPVAHASEQGAGYRLAKLLRDEYWAQTPLDVAKLADEVLSQRPTPATASVK